MPEQTSYNRWTRIGASALQDIYARISAAGMAIMGRDYSSSTRTNRTIPANQYRYTLETGDRYVRAQTFQPMISESTAFHLNTLGYGQDFFTPEDGAVANTALVDFQNGRVTTGITGAGSRIFYTRLIQNYAAYDRVRIIHDASLNGGTIAYAHIVTAGATTAIPLDTDTVVPAVGNTWYIRVTLTNSGTGVSPELRWFIAGTRVNAAPAPANANAFFIGHNLYGVR